MKILGNVPESISRNKCFQKCEQNMILLQNVNKHISAFVFCFVLSCAALSGALFTHVFSFQICAALSGALFAHVLFAKIRTNNDSVGKA